MCLNQTLAAILHATRFWLTVLALFAASLLLVPNYATTLPTLERVDNMCRRIESKMNLPETHYTPPIMLGERNQFIVDGNGAGYITLTQRYNNKILAHELCHALQHRHGLELSERACQRMDYLMNIPRPVWRLRSH